MTDSKSSVRLRHSNAPVSIRGRLVPGYALSDSDDRIPFWREVGRRIHEYDCKYILQLSHAGRQRDIGGIEFEKGLSSTDKDETLNGFHCERMTKDQIRETVNAFAQGARRAREAGLDGVELHGAPIEVGARVTVIQVDGTTLVVEKES